MTGSNETEPHIPVILTPVESEPTKPPEPTAPAVSAPVFGVTVEPPGSGMEATSSSSGGDGSGPPPQSPTPEPEPEPRQPRVPFSVRIGQALAHLATFIGVSWRYGRRAAGITGGASRSILQVCRSATHPYRFVTENHYQRMMAAMQELGLLYAITIALGVPIMGFVSDTPLHQEAKRIIVEAWLIVIPLVYWTVQISGLVAQMELYKILEVERAEQQRSSMMLPYWGVAVAVVVWLLGIASGGRWFSLHYGLYEWVLIGHTFITTFIAVGVLYPLIGHYQSLSASVQRFERDVHGSQ